MLELSLPAALPYLAERFGVREDQLSVSELGDGVSNLVWKVEMPGTEAVVKQPLLRLKVQQKWICSRRRVWNEIEGLKLLGERLPAGAVPQILWEDRARYVYAMEAAPEGANLKRRLLAGEFPEKVLRALGEWMASWLEESEDMARRFPSLWFFEQLRLAPYYQATAERWPLLAGFIGERIEAGRRQRRAFVHGDFSPKNVMVAGERATLIDFEVAHYGDPGFDGGFFTNHLLLKSFYQPQWAAQYRRLAEVFWAELDASPAARRLGLARSSAFHLGALLLARIDGKSPVEYLLRDEEKRAAVRAWAEELLRRPPEHPLAAFERGFA